MLNKLKEFLPFLPWACSLTFLTPNFSTLSCSYILHDEEPHSKFCNQYALTCNCQNWIFKQQITTKIIYHCCLNTKAKVSLTMMQVMTRAMWPSNQIRVQRSSSPIPSKTLFVVMAALFVGRVAGFGDRPLFCGQTRGICHLIQ